MKHLVASALLVAAFVLLPACGDPAPTRATTTESGHVLLEHADAVLLETSGSGALAQPLLDAFGALDGALAKAPTLLEIAVVQPEEGETLIGDDEAPRFLWRDPAGGSDTWYATVRFGESSDADMKLLVLGGMPPEAVLDPSAMSLHAWTPSPAVWATIVKQAADAPVVVTLVGFAATMPGKPLAQGVVSFQVEPAR